MLAQIGMAVARYNSGCKATLHSAQTALQGASYVRKILHTTQQFAETMVLRRSR